MRNFLFCCCFCCETEKDKGSENAGCGYDDKKNKAATSKKIYATTRNDEHSFIIHSLQKFFNKNKMY